VSILEIDTYDLSAKNMVSHYFQLHKYIDDSSVELWHSINYVNDFGFPNLTPAGISAWMNDIESHKSRTLSYLAQKVGYTEEDQEIPLQNIYIDDLDIISASKYNTGKFICQVHKSLTATEFQSCNSGLVMSVEDLLFQ